jgi:hypothetical protein
MEKQCNYDEIDVPENLETKLEALIDQWAETEKQAKRKTRQLRLWMTAIAASFAFAALTCGLLFLEKKSEPQHVEWKPNYIEDPETAYMEMQKALLLISSNLNKGLDQLMLTLDEIEKSNETISNKLHQTFKK